MKRTILLITMLLGVLMADAQLRKVYDETIDPMQQIDQALQQAGSADKFVICQVGGNWCRWCLMFADFIERDADISSLIDDNYVYIHVDYSDEKASEDLKKRLGYPRRFGFPALVILNPQGEIVHIQDSGLLEQGQGYDREKVMRFFKLWTPAAVSGQPVK